MLLYICDLPCAIDRVEHLPSWEMPAMHSHVAYEIYVIEEGHTNVMLRDKLYRASKGNILLFPSYALHRACGGEHHIRWTVYFSSEYLAAHFTSLSLQMMTKCFEAPVRHLEPTELRDLLALLKRFENAYNSERHNEVFMLLATLLFMVNSAKVVDVEKQIGTGAVQTALNYINANYKSIENIDEIVAKTYVTKEYLCSAFKKSTGFTITQYINNLRINLSCDLLSSTRMSVTDIAFECGFNSSAYFGRTFKELTRQTPHEFRKTLS